MLASIGFNLLLPKHIGATSQNTEHRPQFSIFLASPVNIPSVAGTPLSQVVFHLTAFKDAVYWRTILLLLRFLLRYLVFPAGIFFALPDDERRVKMTHGEVVWLSGCGRDEEVALVVTDRSDVLRSYLQCHIAEVEVFHVLAVAFRKVDDDALQSS